jgi:hypothetical protein
MEKADADKEEEALADLKGSAPWPSKSSQMAKFPVWAQS